MDFTLPDWVPYVVIAVLVVLIIWWKFLDDLLFAFKGIYTDGVIINWMGASEKGKKYFYPLIEFHSADGTRHTYRAEERSEDAPMYSQGTVVRVKYLPSNPKMVKTIYPDSPA